MANPDHNNMETRRVRGPIYLDNQATTRTDPRVVDAMVPYFSEKFGNPHSRSHAFGWEAEDAVEAARQSIAELIGAEAREIIFTSGATEANNLAIKGVAEANRARGNRIVTVATEHKCVLETCRHLEGDGFEVVYLGVDGSGLIDLAELAAAIDENTVLVSVMGVNNETGVIQPVAEIGEICRRSGVVFHSDCAQAAGKIELDVEAMNVDLMSLSAHKMYGPMGIGALYVRRRPRVRLAPLLDGGGQEQGLRSGTLPAPLCVGFGMAARICADEMAAEVDRTKDLRSRFLENLKRELEGVHVNGHMTQRIAGNLNVRFDGVTAVQLLSGIKGVAFSAGSACTSASVEPSYVLRAMGLRDADADSSVRFGFGRFTTEGEIDLACELITDCVGKVRNDAGAAEAAAGQKNRTNATAA